MKNVIEEIKIEKASDIIKDKVVFERAKKDKVVILRVGESKLGQEDLKDSLLDLEITLRKCERVGVFND